MEKLYAIFPGPFIVLILDSNSEVGANVGSLLFYPFKYQIEFRKRI